MSTIYLKIKLNIFYVNIPIIIINFIFFIVSNNYFIYYIININNTIGIHSKQINSKSIESGHLH